MPINVHQSLPTEAGKCVVVVDVEVNGARTKHIARIWRAKKRQDRGSAVEAKLTVHCKHLA